MKIKKRVRWMGALCALASAAPSLAQITTEVVVDGLVRPVFVASPPNDSSRLMVLDTESAGPVSGEYGEVLLIKDGVLQTQPFLSLPQATAGPTSGLTGLAFHPNYAANGLFYVMYAIDKPQSRRGVMISQFTRQAGTSDMADPMSEICILDIESPSGTEHMGGRLHFGPGEGGSGPLLYASVGDGGFNVDPITNLEGQEAARLNSVWGKILRLDVDNPGPCRTIANPTASAWAPSAGNPFDGPGVMNLIWSIGLRNPYGFSIDSGSATNDFWIGDVGRNQREEVDRITYAQGNAGVDFEWPCREGTFPSNQPFPCVPAGVGTLTPPLFDEMRFVSRAVIGGQVYRGVRMPRLVGEYFFGFSTGFGGSIYERYDPVSGTRFDLSAVLNDDLGGDLTQAMFGGGIDAEGEMYITIIATGATAGAVLRVLPIEIGSSYCPQTVICNTGSGQEPEVTAGEVFAVGSNVVVDNDFELYVIDMPINTFGYFINGTSTQSVAGPGGSIGTLCIGGSVGRFSRPGEIMNSGPDGAFSLVVDLTDVPTPSGAVSIAAGSTWYFQCWHRDQFPVGCANAGMTTSNFSTAYSVLFQ